MRAEQASEVRKTKLFSKLKLNRVIRDRVPTQTANSESSIVGGGCLIIID